MSIPVQVADLEKQKFKESSTPGQPGVVVISSDGSDVGSPTTSYKINDYTNATAPNYYGYERADGAWFIKKIDDSTTPVTIRYSKGASAYATAWTNRASQSYDTYGNTF